MCVAIFAPGHAAAHRAGDRARLHGPRHLLVLTHLRSDGPAAQQTLIDIAGVDPSNLVGPPKLELEDAGLIVRSRDRADRRRGVIELSRKPRNALDAVDRALRSVDDQALAAPADNEPGPSDGRPSRPGRRRRRRLMRRTTRPALLAVRKPLDHRGVAPTLLEVGDVCALLEHHHPAVGHPVAIVSEHDGVPLRSARR